ncbi:uncharacterized protein F5Z01DRAFT_123322 [Emericellopsis atlantica]|uniref:Uncharacterized protein n=1 Tax=Emericellopsis atlantica TaxID=2614577 RepID=A0A9P7ZM64_9HYPO|nr:uncharacterized protein F5Z01DRAFT_123322 [Emericellopsis atlantica]KAG9254257.1 hypothetical protein F5Z01DRAFT_123322 [Emericellopsis atlantica]
MPLGRLLSDPRARGAALVSCLPASCSCHAAFMGRVLGDKNCTTYVILCPPGCSVDAAEDCDMESAGRKAGEGFLLSQPHLQLCTYVCSILVTEMGEALIVQCWPCASGIRQPSLAICLFPVCVEVETRDCWTLELEPSCSRFVVSEEERRLSRRGPARLPRRFGFADN